MSHILDQFAQSTQFTPASVEQYIALQLSKHLNDESAIGRYLHYVSRYPLPLLLNQFQQAKTQSDPARAFHSSIKQREP